MLIKLLPENITKNWDTISISIKESLPPIAGEGIDKMNRILESLLAGSLECWVVYKYEEDGPKIQAIGTTQILYEMASGIYNLLIYTMAPVRKMQEEEWVDAYMSLAEYAKANKCIRIVAYTKNPVMLDVITKLGADTDTRFISLAV